MDLRGILITDHKKISHPIMNASPPRGVMAPNQVWFVNERMYRLPLKMMIPIANSRDDVLSLGNFSTRMPVASKARVW